jgi:hypothetical protein
MERGYLPALDVLYDVYRATGRSEEQHDAGRSILEAHRLNPGAVERYVSRARLTEIEGEITRLEGHRD